MDKVNEIFSLWFTAIYDELIQHINRLPGFLGVDDIAQEVATALLLELKRTGLNPFQDKSHMLSWCKRRANWTASHRFRALKQEARFGKDLKHSTNQLSKISQPVVSVEGIESGQLEIFELVDRLPAQQRKALLASIQGYSNSEIAQRFGVEESTVRSLLRHARARIATKLTEA